MGRIRLLDGAVGGFQRSEALTFKDQGQQFAIESVRIHEQHLSRHGFHFNCTQARSFNFSSRRPRRLTGRQSIYPGPTVCREAPSLLVLVAASEASLSFPLRILSTQLTSSS